MSIISWSFQIRMNGHSEWILSLHFYIVLTWMHSIWHAIDVNSWKVELYVSIDGENWSHHLSIHNMDSCLDSEIILLSIPFICVLTRQNCWDSLSIGGSLAPKPRADIDLLKKKIQKGNGNWKGGITWHSAQCNLQWIEEWIRPQQKIKERSLLVLTKSQLQMKCEELSCDWIRSLQYLGIN